MEEVEAGDFNWKPLLTYIGIGAACLALGAFVVAPRVDKWKQKKLAAKNESAKAKGST